MSETATIASSSGSSSSNGGGRPALDLADTVPFTRMPNIRLTGAAAPTHESFVMSDKFIYSTSSSPATAIYHLSTRNTRSGQPWQLAISHLLPSEVRLLAAAAATAAASSSSPSSAAAAPAPFIKYDDDLTLYTGERLAVPISIGQKPLLCIRGRRRAGGGGLSGGTVVVEKTLGRSRTYKFWHMTPIRRPLTQAEEDRMQALMRRRGYRSSDDWNKELLYTAQGRGGGSSSSRGEAGEMEWTDDRGVVVAREADGQLTIGGGAEPLEAGTRDLLVACWASRVFVRSTPESETTTAA
ncbi:hypothetical protein IF1G_01123 [Cordyceps javanica]|uniref:Uncharacterized protein n=1 Tax=Cordyceps javanica TaxID=43265 RepID=A0A545VHJ0_9HYPO|nr:hypothetical protein IF1G_01123 [Cordyceps javanica]TQW12345.1 hypothetical protein IF2G_01076 [Cordyceps javanica]